MNNISSWEAETKELIERVSQELKDAMTQVDMLQQRKWALEEAVRAYMQMRGTKATRTIKWLNPDFVKDKSYREVLSLIARENEGLLIVRHATRLLKEAQAFGDSPNADSIVYSILNRSPEFVRVGRGVYKLNSVHKEIKSTVRKERIPGLKQAILELKTVNPDMTKQDVRDTLIKRRFDFQGKSPSRCVHILWVNLGYAKQDKEAQRSLFGER